MFLSASAIIRRQQTVCVDWNEIIIVRASTEERQVLCLPFFHSICLNMFHILLSNTSIVQCNRHTAEDQRAK